MNSKNTLQKIFVPSLLATCIAANTAHAARSETQQALVEGGTFATATLVGTAVAGPVGFVIGAIGGAFLADQTQKANQVEKTQITLKQIEAERENLEQTLDAQNLTIVNLEQSALERLTFQVLFATGKDTLNNADLDRVATLAAYLNQHPELTVTLAGHTDPRGTDEYNNVLSQERAAAIKTALEQLGVDPARIQSKGHGSSFSKASKGDLEAYAEDRRVDIHIESPSSSAIAQN